MNSGVAASYGDGWFGEAASAPSPAVRRGGLPAGIFAAAGAMAVTGTLLGTGGNLPAAAAVMAGLALLAVTWLRVEWSLYLFVGTVLVMDQEPIPGFSPLTHTLEYFKNLKENPFLPSYSIAMVNPLELHLFLIIVVWFVALGVKRLRLQQPPVWGALAAFFAALAAGFVHGVQSGGDLLPALWEVRALFYLGILACLVPQIIQTKEQISTLLWVCILAIAFKAFQGIARFARLGFSFQGQATLTNHEDPLFIFTLVVLLAGLIVFGARCRQRAALLLLLAPLLLGFFAGQRRAAYAAAGLGLAAFVASLPAKELRRLARTVFPVAGALVIYSAAFWNSDSKWASPVRLIKTGISNDRETAGDRFYSNLYRDFEIYDLAVTVRGAPVTGTGFGKKYLQPIPLAEIPFTLREYIPHNHILWILVKLGAVGFCLFFFLVNAILVRTTIAAGKAADPYLRAVACMIAAAVIGQVVVSYYDLQLTYYRNMVYLGTLIGLVPTIRHLAEGPPASAAAAQPPPGRPGWYTAGGS